MMRCELRVRELFSSALQQKRFKIVRFSFSAFSHFGICKVKCLRRSVASLGLGALMVGRPERCAHRQTRDRLAVSLPDRRVSV